MTDNPGTPEITENRFHHAVSDDGRRRQSAAATRHGAAAVLKQLQNGVDFSGLQLERQQQAIDRMALNPDAGGIIGEIDKDLSRIAAAADLCEQATLAKAAAGDVKGWHFYTVEMAKLIDRKHAIIQRRQDYLAADDNIIDGAIADARSRK